MKSFTTKAKSITALLLAALLTASLFGCAKEEYSYDPSHEYDEIYDSGEVELEVDDSGVFTVFKINDTHFINGTCKQDKQTLDDLKAALDSSDFDLIIVDGDLIEGYNNDRSFDKYRAASIFAELIESYDVLWTFAPGNNDGQEKGTNEDLIAFFMDYDNFLCGNKKGVDGAMQFMIDLMRGDEIVHSIAIMDSLSTDYKGDYEHIRETQTNWLLDAVNRRKVKTSVFFHMPTPAFKTAYEQGEAYEGFPFCTDYAVDDIKQNEDFDNAIADNEYISLISTAHVHSDNIAYFYNNRYYQLSSLGGYSAVGSKNTKPSYTLISIDTTETDNRNVYGFCKVPQGGTVVSD